MAAGWGRCESPAAIRSPGADTIQFHELLARSASAIFLSSFFDAFLPIVRLWELLIKNPLAWLLGTIYQHLQGVPVLETIGAYGVSIIVVTIMIRLLLAPLQQFQLVNQRKSMVEQRKLAPEVAELRKKYKKDPQKMNSEMMQLYKEHGVNPLAPMIGCLPLVVQIPILSALYYVFRGANVGSPHFLFVPNLMAYPSHTYMIAGLPIPAVAYLVFPLLAAATTLVQSRMLQQPTPPNPTEQELQTQQMQRTMVYLSPLMIGYFALQVPAGLGLYWFVGNCVSIIQQSFVVGWGNLLPKRGSPPAAAGQTRALGSRPGPGAMSKEPPRGANGGSSQPRKKKNRRAR